MIALGSALINYSIAQLMILIPIDGGPSHIITIMWAPSGITFALTWRFGRPALIGCGLGMLGFLLQRYGHPLFAVLAAIGHLAPAAYANWQLRRNGIEDPFGNLRNVVQFIVFAVLIAPLLSSSFSLLYPLLRPSAKIQWHLDTWFVLWANDAIAILLLAPVLLRLGDWRSISRTSRLEFLVWMFIVVFTWWQIFLNYPQTSTLPLSVLSTPFLILAAFRFNFGVVATITLVLSLFSLLSLTHNPYGDNSGSFYFGMLYLASLGMSNLAVGAGSSALRFASTQVEDSEALLRGMFEQAAVGMLLIDLRTNQRTCNPQLADMLGYSMAEIASTDLRTVTFEDEQQLTDTLIARMQGGEIDDFNQEKRYIRKDGGVIWVNLTMSIQRGSQGAKALLIGIFTDITARKLAERKLLGQTRILRDLTADQPLQALLNDVALLAEELMPSSCCAIFLVDASGENLHLAAAPNWPAQTSRPSTPIPIEDNRSPTISAAARKANVFCPDILATPEHAALHPLIQASPWRRACWSLPFLGKNQELFGVLTLYFDHPRAPNAQDEELINMINSLAGLVVQHHRDEEKLRDSEQRFRITFEQAAVGVALLDRDSNWLQVNQKFCETVGYDHDELTAQIPYSKLISPEDMEYTVQSVAGVLNNAVSQVQLDHRYMRKNGDVIWVNSQFSVIRNSDGGIDYQIAIIKDITERKLAESEIERLALYDYLTELPNRRLFGDRLRTAVMVAKRSARFGALIYIDLDNFKQLNDTHGHNAGDDFLRMVAHRLQRNLREEDTVARLGGDEFVVLLQNVSDSLDTAATATAAIAEKIQSALSEPFLLQNGIEHIVTSSLGITLFPKDEENAEELLREADIAMYRVKESQRNAMRFYEPAMKAEVDSRLALERALRRALQDNEFELYLQPQYDGERKMVSCEALLRWPQADGGFVSPAEFIPLAEETGLIVPLGEWVLRRAGLLVSSLELVGLTLSICVNVSPRQFSEANFVERVRTILWEAGADAGRIVLEITEGVVVADFDDVRTKMHALREMGITLSIDDFGTGHSSLAYLKLLPLHELKIDRAFVDSLPDDANDVAIVEAVLSVARHLQLEVVAEGVETVEQFEFLKARDCHRFQGYLLAKPAPPQQIFPALETLPRWHAQANANAHRNA